MGEQVAGVLAVVFGAVLGFLVGEGADELQDLDFLFGARLGFPVADFGEVGFACFQREGETCLGGLHFGEEVFLGGADVGVVAGTLGDL